MNFSAYKATILIYKNKIFILRLASTVKIFNIENNPEVKKT